MIKRTGLIGTKIGNSSFYDDSGKSLPVTILKIDECIVSDIKTIEKHGYSSLQLVSINTKITTAFSDGINIDWRSNVSRKSC